MRGQQHGLNQQRQKREERERTGNDQPIAHDRSVVRETEHVRKEWLLRWWVSFDLESFAALESERSVQFTVGKRHWRRFKSAIFRLNRSFAAIDIRLAWFATLAFGRFRSTNLVRVFFVSGFRLHPRNRRDCQATLRAVPLCMVIRAGQVDLL